jgi:hypothetical protein
MNETDIDRLLTELTALKIRVDRLETEQRGDQASLNGERKIQVGDRVKIRNKVRKPTTWPKDKAWTEPLERQATVTRITNDRVYITTKNGTHTWRHLNNLKRTDNQDQQGPT